jgi:hypothetical protein
LNRQPFHLVGFEAALLRALLRGEEGVRSCRHLAGPSAVARAMQFGRKAITATMTPR